MMVKATGRGSTLRTRWPPGGRFAVAVRVDRVAGVPVCIDRWGELDRGPLSLGLSAGRKGLQGEECEAAAGRADEQRHRDAPAAKQIASVVSGALPGQLRP